MAADFLANRSSIDERAAIVQRRLNAGTDAALFGMSAALASAITSAVEEATVRTSQRLLEFAEFLVGPESAPQRLAANQTLGRMMHDSVKRSYRAHSRAAAVYSPASPTRMKPGSLQRALSDPTNIYRATADELLFVNETGLSRDALQWARLNYGAGGRGRGSIGPFQVRFSDLVIAEFGLEEEPRPAFTIPRGYFWDGEGIVASNSGARGQHPFYPSGVGPLGKSTKLAQRGRGRGSNAGSLSISRRLLTQGITGWNFLDKGVERLADNFGPVYTRMYEHVFTESLRRGGSAFTTFTVHPSRATRFPFTS